MIWSACGFGLLLQLVAQCEGPSSVAGDANSDGAIDLLDYERFVACAGAIGAPLPDEECLALDFDDDSIIGFADFGGFQRAFATLPLCGDGRWAAAEGCDDGNNTSGDGCDAFCCLELAEPPAIRAAWSASSVGPLLFDGGPVDMLLDAGVTHFAVKMPSLRPEIGDGDRLTLERWSEKLNARGAKLWIFFNWFAVNEEPWLLPLVEPYVGPDGVETLLKPCPQSREFWERSIKARFVGVAEYASITDTKDFRFIPGFSEALDGVMLDPELYGFPGINRTYNDPCYCDSCFAGFFTDQAIPDVVPPRDERVAYLVANGLVDAYAEFERVRVLLLADECRAAFETAAPALDLKIGGTNLIRFDRSTFYVGLAQGFGTPTKPYYDLTQRTANYGFNASYPVFLNEVRDAGIFAVILPGLFLDRVPPDAVTDHFYTLAALSGGGWLDRTCMFGPLIDSLCFPAEEYLAAIALANAELDLLSADACHVSQYRGREFVPGCVNSEPYVTDGLIPLEPGPPAEQSPTFRRETGYFFHAVAGQPILFDICFIRFGSNDPGAGWWSLISPSGTMVASAPMNAPLNPAEIRATASETGVYSIILNTSFVHGFQFLDSSHPGSYGSVLGTQRLGVFQADAIPGPQFFAFVPPGESVVSIELKASASEGSVVQIFDERDPTVPLFDGCVDETLTSPVTFTVQNNNAGGEGVVLSFTIIRENLDGKGGGCGMAEDLSIRFLGGALPYLSQTRSGLFRSTVSGG